MTSNARRAVRRAFLPLVAVGAPVVLALVLVYPVRGYRIPIGSDTPVYVWWARLAGATGLGPFGTGARPGIVGLLASLSTLTGTPAAGVAAALTPALAAAAALAVAMLTARAVGPFRPRQFVMVGLLAGTFLSFVAAGYESTVAFAAFFLAGLAVVADGFGHPPVRSTVAAAALFGTAGLVHPLFLAFAAPLLAGSAVALLPSWRRDRRAGVRPGATALGRLVASSAAGAAVAAGGLLLSGVGASAGADTSRDAILKRTGLLHALRASYLRKLRHDFPWWRTVPVLALAATAFLRGGLPAWRPGEADAAGTDRRRAFVGLLVAWMALTVAGVVALLAGTLAPGQRLADLCLPLPILAGLGLSGMWARGRRHAVLAGAGALAFLFLAFLPWWSSTPLVTTTQLDEARAVGGLLASRGDVPVVVVMDDRSDKPGLSVTRYMNLVRDEVPAARAGQVLFFVGTPADLEARMPTSTGQPEHDRMADDAWRRIEPLLTTSDPARRPLVVAVQGLDPAGYAQALTLPGARAVVPGVVELPPYAPPAQCIACDAAHNEPGPAPMSPWLPVWLGPLLLAGFAVIGWPWTRMALPRSESGTVLALAPALGAAALALASVVTDAVGLRLSGSGAWTAGALALGAWVLFGLDGRRRRLRESASAPTPGSP